MNRRSNTKSNTTGGTRANSTGDVEEIWTKDVLNKAIIPLQKALDTNFNVNVLTNEICFEVYATCYELCLNQNNNTCQLLYKKHEDTFKDYAVSIHKILLNFDGEILIHQFNKYYDNNNVLSKWMSVFLCYLDIFYIKTQNLTKLNDKASIIFKEFVFDKIKNKLNDVINNMINEEREHNRINSDAIKSIIQFYIEIDLNSSLVTYNKDFVEPYLVSTNNFYAPLIEKWLNDYPVITYLELFNQIMHDEIKRVDDYFYKFCKNNVVKHLKYQFIENNIDKLLYNNTSGLLYMFLNDKIEGANLLYNAILGIDNYIDKIANMLANTIENNYVSIMADHQSRIDNKIVSKHVEDIQLIKDYIGIYEKYNAFLEKSFNNNGVIVKKFNDTFSQIINKSVDGINIPEMIAYFCDKLLKSGNSEKLEEADIENYLDKNIVIFSYVYAKDLFIETYSSYLAKRLLLKKSLSDDLEKSLITKIKIKCGTSHTYKLEGMITDISIGNVESAGFNQHLIERPELKNHISNIDLEFQVLTLGCWPTFKTVDLKLPIEMQKCHDTILEYYKRSTSNKKLSFVYAHGNVAMKGIFKKGTYEMNITTLQAVLLMAFNPSNGKADNGMRDFQKLLDITGMKPEILKCVLHSLTCGKFKIIKRFSKEGEEIKDPKLKLSDSENYQYNDGFTSPLKKFGIPMASVEDINITKKVEEDRSFAVEATIVRIMKARKTLDHNNLITEVLSQLILFRPDVKLIKQKIESLIEREYLERDENNNRMYKYLA